MRVENQASKAIRDAIQLYPEGPKKESSGSRGGELVN
jgi:hypothetical protein